jgi:iron complex outermembrane receptor protein
MKIPHSPQFIYFICFFLGSQLAVAQGVVRGVVLDELTGDPLINATVVIKGTTVGVITDFDGRFELTLDRGLPLSLMVTYVGYTEKEVQVTALDRPLQVKLAEETITTDVVEVRGQRVSDKQRAAPLTVESLDMLAIKETPSDNFYDGLGALKGVDLTAASLGFKIINMRGFNSTSPVRTLQIIDGVDNQAPGLNFSLGNFLGSPELDVLRVDLIQGASSAFYGPNAFNGVISMESKSPFLHKGLGAMIKAGERSLAEGALRYADAIKNKNGRDLLGYKINFSYLRAYDWEADNYNPIDGSRVPADNPGRFDAVNIYGDEYFPLGDASSPSNQWGNNAGLGVFYRTGYREVDLVDYNTRNIKANLAFHLRTAPNKELESPELIFSSNYGYGTTVYQGDNRFSLRDIQFFQNRLEFRKRDKFFIRAYATADDAGNSFDPYFTALRLKDRVKSDENWAQDYVRWWRTNRIGNEMVEMGYPQLNFGTFPPTFDQKAADEWLSNSENRRWLAEQHRQAEVFANQANPTFNTEAFLEPGTERFREAFREITSSLSNEEGGGTRFYDRSALYHVHGEYRFEPTFLDEWVVGGNSRLYTPQSRGTIFFDTAGVRITNFEFGAYTGASKYFFDRKLRASATIRVDKNQNFDWISTPAASLVYNPSVNNFLRVSFSSAIRNPTLTDQYLFLNVGRAILAGNLEGVEGLITLESFESYRNTLQTDSLVYFNIDPVRPERVKTFEVGYRTTLWNSLYVDAGYYFNLYDDFLGFNIGLDVEFDETTNLPTAFQAYRYAANSREKVQTQGFAIGLNYYFANYFQLSGNYSWNQLISDVKDPIIPAFNTPEHKFNISFSGRNIRMGPLRDFGFNVNYKWIEGFLFEGSPQFTGFIPTYDLLDAQINYHFRKINTTVKFGASNLLDNRQFQTYGGPRIGRLAYVSATYEFKKR